MATCSLVFKSIEELKLRGLRLEGQRVFVEQPFEQSFGAGVGRSGQAQGVGHVVRQTRCRSYLANLAEFYPEASWQRCVVHFYRNVWTAVPTGKVKGVAAMLKAVHAQEDAQAAREKAAQVVEKLKAMKLARAAEIVAAGVEETLSYYGMPSEHWRSIKTNNPLERLMREIRRRTRVVGAFPDGKSALMLVAARLRYVAATRWGTKRYLQMNRLAEVVAIA